MKKLVSINGVTVKTNGFFAFDGCHKMYILESDADESEARDDYGFKILPIDLLEDTYLNACPLKFISPWCLQGHYVPQGKIADFCYEDENQDIESSMKYTEVPDEE